MFDEKMINLVWQQFDLRQMKMKKTSLYSILVPVFFCLHSFCYAQNTDSLWKVYNNKTRADTIRLEAIDKVAWSYSLNNPDSAIQLAKLELELALAGKRKDYQASALVTMGASCNNKGDQPKALEYLFKALPIYKETGDNYGLTSCYNNIGEAYRIQTKYPAALENYLISLRIREKVGDK